MPRKPQTVVKIGNSFAALAESDSDIDETVVHLPILSIEHLPAPEVKQSPPFRVWTIDDADIRFKNDTNIFSSPFSRKKNWSRPRFKEDDQGWVSIQIGQPEELPQPEIENESEIVPESQAFPSMLKRGDQEIALVWAEKVKKSLEKAEKVRSEFKRGKTADVGTKLSFFRKTE